MRTMTIPCAALFVSVSAVISLAGDDVAAEIKAVVAENLSATQAEDADRVMRTIHTKSPGYAQTKKQVLTIFEKFDLSYKMLSFSYVGADGEYAVARVRQSTRKTAGAKFQDNELDLIQVFRKEDGKWKFWSQAILEVKLLN